MVKAVKGCLVFPSMGSGVASFLDKKDIERPSGTYLRMFLFFLVHIRRKTMRAAAKRSETSPAINADL